MTRLNGQFYMIKEAQIFCFQPGMIPGYGMGNSIELNLQDKTGGDMTTFYNNAMKVPRCVESASGSGNGIYFLRNELPQTVGRSRSGEV